MVENISIYWANCCRELKCLIVHEAWKKRLGLSFQLFAWPPGLTLLFQAVANARLVGAQIAYLIQILNHVTGVSTKSVHIIGHSLGAHIAGYAGKRLANEKFTLGRISGMELISKGAIWT